jgi:hypothetical protein
MQMTSELLRRYAQITVEKQTKADYTILAAYLTGSLVTEEEPLLGGSGDIDLVFIHIGDPRLEREILPINDDIHYDIAHHPQRDYLERLALRTHPWKGPVLSEAVALYDPQHFMDLTQASVRGLFHRTYNVAQRAQTQMQAARRRWLDFQPLPLNPGPPEILTYLGILDRAANAVALLSGEPLTERRFLINFQRRATRVGRPGLYPGLLGMLGAPHVDPQSLAGMLPEWGNTYRSLPEAGRHPRMHPLRLNYYLKAFNTILESDQPENLLWPLLRTWTLAASGLVESDPGYQSWRETAQQLGLLGSGFSERIQALDVYLEQVEETINTWEKSTRD